MLFNETVAFLDDQVVEVASRGDALIKKGIKYVLGEVPNWVRQGKERVQKILPKTGDDLEQSLVTTLDEGTVTRTRTRTVVLFTIRSRTHARAKSI